MSISDRWKMARHAVQPAEHDSSLPMYLSPDPEPESNRLNRQNRATLLFATIVMIGFTWMPAVMISDPQPNLFWRAAVLFGWPRVFAGGFVVAGVMCLPFLFIQYCDPHGALRRDSSRWAQLGMLLAASGWVLLASKAWVIDAPFFTAILLWHAGISTAFSWVIGESLNNELILSRRGSA